jgi:hypothetical protein
MGKFWILLPDSKGIEISLYFEKRSNPRTLGVWQNYSKIDSMIAPTFTLESGVEKLDKVETAGCD